jgi:hypothetical protein
MDAMRVFLEDLKRHGFQRGHTLGLFQLLIGRRVENVDGSLISLGLTWRGLALLLKKVRWSKEAVRELGLDPASLPPRNRYQFWYTAITMAQVDSPEARQAGEDIARQIEALGYRVL